MRVLITGTAGFIGKNLSRRLEGSYEIHSLNEDIFLNQDWQEEIVKILNSISPEVIFHMGACSDTMESNVNYMMTRNFESTKILMDWSKINHVPLVYSSSAANYGVSGQYPANLYGWSKYIAEQYVLSNGGLALRYFNVYGPGESHKGRMSSVIYRAIVAKINNPLSSFKIFPLHPRRDFVYVEDVVNANIYAFENYENLKGSFYDVGSGEACPFEEIFRILEHPYEYLPESDIPLGYQFHTCSNTDKWMPGWKPLYSLNSGILEYLRSEI